ncbi:glycosyltransferase family A protein [Xanthomarina sp. F1114]|uniref:glycosyltransferase family 2 protein n=1 Tax=Xanthomarina sp. F1114 TaxID=2996019 RepID=UPI00225E65FF|nr:glycosyltransferase family A protein [Xanthomarina sp. F1114]MCX7548180.1 glycosyltransferase family A protein [Xanthomarina sp. F1114]
MPLFSIIIPLYNKENFIVKTVQSALDQTCPDFEIIIINDGSTDSSLKQVKNLTDSRIRIFNIENQGVSHARNFGITKASAEYIAFLDADDLWLPNHLEALKNLIDTYPDCGLYASAYEKKIGHISIASNYLNIPQNWTGIVDDFFKSSLVSCIAWTSAVVVPKTVLKNLGGFDEKITLGAGEDTDLWIRIALQYQVAFNNHVTAIYNLHAENRISNSNTNLRQFLDLDVYEEAAKKNPSLKKYLDVNRFSIALQYKLVNNKKQQAYYINNLDRGNLNYKQRFLLNCHKNTLVLLLKTQHILRQLHIDLSPFK